jgi:hypothetical protein
MLGIFQIVWGAIIILTAIALFLLGQRMFSAVANPTGPDKSITLWFLPCLVLYPLLLLFEIVMGGMGALHIACGIGLTRRRRWAFITSALLALLMLANSIAVMSSKGAGVKSVVFSIFIILFLITLLTRTREVFSAAPCES